VDAGFARVRGVDSAAESEALEQACSVAGVPVLDAAALLGQVDEADPAQVAALLRLALEAVAGD
jgi:hypothetical protein